MELDTGEALFEGTTDADQLYLITNLVGPLCPRHQSLIQRVNYMVCPALFQILSNAIREDDHMSYLIYAMPIR